ncbi:MAG: class I SAM-dependent rRNA methyltransferase [Gemmatimonadaceae bacterium]|nr:class I SAM-dependent rRNA methyltransferase [Gemmatimonadaceae bacterium]
MTATTTSRLPIAMLASRGADRLLHGHPWIFRSDIATAPRVDAGLVDVRGPGGRKLGTALYSPTSEITIRRLEANPDVVVDGEWWRRTLARAIARRTPLAEHTTACRLVHGEADGAPSLVVDQYADVLVVQLLSAGLETQRDDIVAALQSLCRPTGVLARNDPSVRTREGLERTVEVLAGTVPDTVQITEHGVHYLAALRTGQKTGAFLDQRENRVLIGSLARGRALDCFSYHGSFALHLARRAAHVTAVDVSEVALARASENAALNGFSNVTPVVADVFEYLRHAKARGERFDTIVVDPPAFAKNRSSVSHAMRGYADINRLAMQLLNPGGMMFTASCSHHVHVPEFLEILAHAAEESGRDIALRTITLQPLDHPILLTVPETGYLKGAVLEAMS